MSQNLNSSNFSDIADTDKTQRSFHKLQNEHSSGSTADDKLRLLSGFLSADVGNPEEKAGLLDLLVESMAFSKLQEFLPEILSRQKLLSPQKSESKRKLVLKFSKKDFEKMTNKYRNIFALGNKIVSYRQKKNGVYEARYHRNGIDVEVSSKDLNVLKQKFIAALNNLAATGSVKDRSCYTVRFNDFAASWLALKEKTTKPLTFREYKRLFDHDIAPAFSDKMLSDIDREFIQNFLFAYVEKGKHRTAEKLHLILRCIFDLAASDYKLDSPMAKVVLPRYQSKKGSAFTYAEEKQLVDYCTSHPELAASGALLVLLYTGMRRSELKTLRVLDENWLECDTSKEKMGQDTVPRRIPVTPMLRKVLPFVDFEKAKDTNVNTINTMIKRLFPHHHTHELRYTFITRCKECGINHELVMLWDGHSFDKDVKTSVVDRGYTDYSEKYALSEANKFDYEL